MPKIMCQICARWTQKEGCELQYKHYWHFRDCMLEVKDHSVLKTDTDPEQIEQEGAADD